MCIVVWVFFLCMFSNCKFIVFVSFFLFCFVITLNSLNILSEIQSERFFWTNRYLNNIEILFRFMRMFIQIVPNLIRILTELSIPGNAIMKEQKPY